MRVGEKRSELFNGKKGRAIIICTVEDKISTIGGKKNAFSRENVLRSIFFVIV